MLLHTKRPRNSSVHILSAFLFAAWEAMAAQTLAALLELAPESVRNDFEPLGPCALRDLAAAQAGAMLGGMTSDQHSLRTTCSNAGIDPKPGLCAAGKATDIVTARFFSCKLLGTYTTPAERGQTEIHNIGASYDDCWAAAACLESSDDHWAAAACSHADSAALPPEKNALEDALRMHAANKASQVWRDLHQRGKNDSQADLWLFRIARNILNKFPHHTDPSWRIRFLYIYRSVFGSIVWTCICLDFHCFPCSG